MKYFIPFLVLLLPGCQTQINQTHRPVPAVVVEFDNQSQHYNNAFTVKQYIKDIDSVLLVSVANKSRATISSNRLFGVANSLKSKNVYTAYRYSRMESDIEYVEVYNLDNKNVGELLYQIKKEGVSSINDRVYPESEYRLFNSEIDYQEVFLNKNSTPFAQVRSLVDDYGWNFICKDSAVVKKLTERPGKQAAMKVTVVEQSNASLNEMNKILSSWNSIYPYPHFDFYFDYKIKEVNCEDVGVIEVI